MNVVPRGVWALAIVGISAPLLAGIGVLVYRIMRSQMIWGSVDRCVGYILVASLWNVVPFVIFIILGIIGYGLGWLCAKIFYTVRDAD